MAPWPFSSSSQSNPPPSTTTDLPPTSPTTDPPTSTSATTTTTSPTATPLPPPPPPTPTASSLRPLRPLFLSLLIACPLVAMLPPRKLDLYTLSLAGVWSLSAGEVARGMPSGWTRSLPLAATFQRASSDPPSRISENEGSGFDGSRGEVGMGDEGEGEEEEGEEVEGGVKAMARKLWMGNQTEGWKEKRLREEREALAQGKGYSDLIGEAVEEAFQQGTGRKGDPPE